MDENLVYLAERMELKPIVTLPHVRKSLRLLNEDILNLVFLEEYDGLFDCGFSSTEKEKEKYKHLLLASAQKRGGAIIYLDGEPVGFILAGTADYVMTGGILPEYARQGVYTVARNTFLKHLYDHGVRTTYASCKSTNTPMQSFYRKMKCVNLGMFWLSRYERGIPIAKCNGVIVGEITLRDSKRNTEFFKPVG